MESTDFLLVNSAFRVSHTSVNFLRLNSSRAISQTSTEQLAQT